MTITKINRNFPAFLTSESLKSWAVKIMTQHIAGRKL